MNRSTITLFVLLIVLGAIAYFLLPSSGEREVSDKTPVLSFAVDSASVVRLDLRKRTKSITLENVGGRWMITSPGRYVADPASVIQVIKGLAQFKVGSLISSNPEKQKLFQVDSSGTRITATDRAGKSASIIIGKMGPSFSEVYCRAPASKDVYLGEGLDSWVVNKELKEWRDKTIMMMPSESVKDLSYGVGARQFVYHRDSSTWKSGSSAVETNLMNPPLTTFANLHADDFVDTVMHFSTHPIQVTVKGLDNVTLQMYPLLPDSSKYFVRSSASQQIYVINKYTAEQILKPLDAQDVLGKPVPSLSSAKKQNGPRTAPKTSATIERKPKPSTSAPAASVIKPPEKTVVPPASAPPKTGTENVSQPVISEKKESTRLRQLTDLTAAKKTPTKKSKMAGRRERKQEQPVGTIPSITEKKANTEVVKPPAVPPQESKQQTVEPAKQGRSTAAEDEGDLTVYTVKATETMPIIAKKFNCTVDQILKWNLLKSIAVKPGQELYIYVKK